LKVDLIEALLDTVKEDLKKDPRFITSLIYGNEKAKELYPSIFGITEEETIQKIKTIEEALDEGLEEKKGKVGEEFYKDLKSAKNRFLKYIGTRKENDISTLNTKMITDYLGSIGKSNTTYNNAKANLFTILTELKRWEYIPVNYAENIKKLKTKPKKNTAFSDELRGKIVAELKTKPMLYYYYLHIYYGLMLPKTIIRLKVKDIDLERRMFNTDTKTGNFIKFINQKLYDEVYSKIDFDTANPEDYIFNQLTLVGDWNSNEKSKVNFYTKKFKPYKDKFSLSTHYTWYSFRHTAIGKIFENKVEELKKENQSNYIEKAIDFVRQFTNHTTNQQTKQYLRDISTELHVDWSGYL